jgi:hypothetical protein
MIMFVYANLLIILTYYTYLLYFYILLFANYIFITKIIKGIIYYNTFMIYLMYFLIIYSFY